MTAIHDIQRELDAIIEDLEKLAKFKAEDARILAASANAERERPWYKRKIRIPMAEHLRMRADRQYHAKAELEGFIKRLRDLL